MNISDKYGGVWGEHPNYRLEDWQLEVAGDYTRLGYWEWVEHQLDSEGCEG